MKLFGISETMPFGKHKGELVGTLIEDESAYVEWLLANTDFRLDEEALEYLESCQE